ncbi:pyruvate kinase [Marinobacterium rhizophilum]|uniref:Pyruvate kinase n=1 Tax=Marinobacterium rhizophilum TaxID=420402 RepID=A0ABY5HJF3_9GAMM|nr:pyruvate kinase [Marinobacterium rhizophilum]UTW12089.1 pyruvate kinase [Marinobacterium rhizophilum]
MRRTKIVATLGPSSETPEQIARLVKAGVDVVRLNFSHGTAEEHQLRADRVRETARAQGRYVAILGDLQGPKIRISRFAEGPVCLAAGDSFILDAALAKDAGNQQRVGIDYKELVDDCSAGDILLLDDGRLVLEVSGVQGREIHTQVQIGGKLSNNKGINRQGGGLSAEALTDKDKADILAAAKIGVDYLAVSFPRSGDDIRYARDLLEATGSKAGIIAKVERAEAVSSTEVLDGIIDASNGVMVARGDLGVEIGDAELIGVQKQIIERARKRNKIVITATQMMESMISSPMPTRAEVSDVANAVFDGTDAVMLSAETAAGDYPVETVEAMVRVINGAEKHPSMHSSKHRINQEFTQIDETIGLAAMYAANHLVGVKALVCMTATGATPLLMSRMSSSLPIFALAPSGETLRRVALFRGVNPLAYDLSVLSNDQINQQAVDALKELDVVADGDLVLITKGDYMNVHGGTNTLKLVRVGQPIH